MDDKNAVDLSQTYEEGVPEILDVVEDIPETPAAEEPEWMKHKREAELAAPPIVTPVESLLVKLELFLLNQPEWAWILAAPRKTRREAITLIAKRLVTIPNRYSGFGQGR